jgi:Na+-driven multidrug efflux pump
MGLNGAAIASILSELIGLLVIFWIVKAKGIESRFRLFSNMKWSREQNNQILTIAYPLMFQHAISIISWQYFFLLVEHHGALSLKISNVMRNVFGIFGGTSWAFASTTNAMVSNLIGQNKEEKIGPLLKKIISISSSIAFIYILLLNIFPRQFLSIFGQGDEFVTAAIPTLRVVTVALFILSFAVIFLNTVIATGKTLITFSIEAVAIFFYCGYIYWSLEYKHLPVHYGWMSEWIYWACLFTPSFLYILYGKWRKAS